MVEQAPAFLIAPTLVRLIQYCSSKSCSRCPHADPQKVRGEGFDLAHLGTECGPTQIAVAMTDNLQPRIQGADHGGDTRVLVSAEPSR